GKRQPARQLDDQNQAGRSVRNRQPARCVPIRRPREMSIFDPESFQSRHIGPSPEDAAEMLKLVRASSMDALIDDAIPPRTRTNGPLALAAGQSEYEYLTELRTIAARNRVF